MDKYVVVVLSNDVLIYYVDYAENNCYIRLCYFDFTKFTNK